LARTWGATGRSPVPSRARRRTPLRGRAWVSGCSAGGALIGRRQHIAGREHAQCIDATAVGTLHPELEAIDAGSFAAAREPPELLQQQPRDGVDALSLRKMHSEELVELLDARHATHGELGLGVTADVLIVLDVELIIDLADDLLDDILDGAQPRHAAVFIDHDRHVIAV